MSSIKYFATVKDMYINNMEEKYASLFTFLLPTINPQTSQITHVYLLGLMH